MELSVTEKDDLRAVLRPLYGPSADSWVMNERVLDLYAELLSRAGNCSRSFDGEQRIDSDFGTRKSMKRKLRRIAHALLNGRRDMYVTCFRNVAYTMRSEFDTAGSGL